MPDATSVWSRLLAEFILGLATRAISFVAALIRARATPPTAGEALKALRPARQHEFFLNDSLSLVWAALESSFGLHKQDVIETITQIDDGDWIILMNTHSNSFEAHVAVNGGLLHIKKLPGATRSPDGSVD